MRILNGPEHWPDLVIVDAMFPADSVSPPTFMAGAFLDLLEKVSRRNQQGLPDVILVSGQNQAAEQFEEIFDEIEEWLDAGRIRAVQAKSLADAGWSFFQAILKRTADNLRQARQARDENGDLAEVFSSLKKLGIIAGDPKMAGVWKAISAAAKVNLPVMIYGEPGTGKELIAKAVYKLSCIQNPNQPFVAWNCATGGQLVESMLFGHLKGSFTGADSNRSGVFESANGGTLLMDEIGDLPKDVQAKLLRALQEKEFVRLGATNPTKFKVRILTATNRDLPKMIRQDEFRSDLYSRLNGLQIELPPLRERKRDIPLLTDHFLEKYNKEFGKRVSLTNDVRHKIEEGVWEGNVRTLDNFIARLVAIHDQQVSVKDVKDCCKDGEISQWFGDALSDSTALASQEDPQQLLIQLAIEVSYGPALTWRALGQDEKKDAANEQEVLKLLRGYFRQDYWKLLDALEDKLRQRESNDPRRIHFLLALLYLVLHPERQASLNDFKQVLTISHWNYLKMVGDTLTGIRSQDGVCLVVAEKQGKKNKNVFALNPDLLDHSADSSREHFSVRAGLAADDLQ